MGGLLILSIILSSLPASEDLGLAFQGFAQVEACRQQGIKTPFDCVDFAAFRSTEGFLAFDDSTAGKDGNNAENQDNRAVDEDWLTKEVGEERKNIWVPVLETSLSFALLWGAIASFPEFSDVEHPSARNFANAFTEDPAWDGDNYFINLFLHPLMGAEMYLMMRNREYSWFESALFSTIGSTAWEYLVESWVEQPSAQDLLLTSTAGSLFGEARYRLRLYLSKLPESVWRDSLIVFIDPNEAFHRFLYK